MTVYDLMLALQQLVENNPSIEDLPVLFVGHTPLAAVEYHPAFPSCVILQVDEPATA